MKMRLFLWGQKSEGQSPATPCCGKENPPEKWGPPLWQELHDRPRVMASRLDGFFVRAKEREWLIDVFAPKIPGEECREHFLKHLIEHNIPTRTGEYAEWIIEYHNVVNAKLGKPRWKKT